ncbi:hypothetical protein VPHD81_0054 [Vibrio phage D81]
MAIETTEVNIGDKDYRIGNLSPDDQMKNLYLMQRHDVSGTFMALVLFGMKPNDKLQDKEKGFDQLARTVMAQMQKSMTYEEWQGFVKSMLSKVFKIGSEKPEPVSPRDFQGQMKNMQLLVAHSMRFQYSDFFCLSDQN